MTNLAHCSVAYYHAYGCQVTFQQLGRRYDKLRTLDTLQVLHLSSRCVSVRRVESRKWKVESGRWCVCVRRDAEAPGESSFDITT